MDIDELSVKIGLNVSANLLQPAVGDLLVLKVEQTLNSKQREAIEETVLPLIRGIGCKVLLLDSGAELVLIRQVAADETA